MSQKLRWGVLGAAGIARAAVLPAITRSRNGTLIAIASRNPDEAAQQLSPSSAVDVVSYEALLTDPRVDAIYIPLPNSMHAEWTIRAAEAGKAVLCEKPLAMTAAEAAHVAARCEAAGSPLMEGFMYRSHPQHNRVRALIAEGAIGEVTEVRAHLCVDIMNPPDPRNVRFSPQLGGGSLMDMGCYAISICRMIFGSEPVRVSARWHIDPTYNVDVGAGGVLEFPGGRFGIVSCSFVGNGQGSYTVVGRKGSIELPRGIILGLGTRVGEALIVVVDGDGRRREELLPAVDHYQLMVEEFADAVLARKAVPLPPSDSIRNMMVLDAMARSARSGRVEEVDKSV